METPAIFEYTDFKLFLKDSYKYLKSCNKSFTHRYIISKVGASSSGWFSDILNGKISLSSMFRMRLAGLLKLNETEIEYFENLVNYEQASTFEEKKMFFERLMKAKLPDAKQLLEHQFDFYRIWYVSAIRELLLDYEFTGSSYKELGELIIPAISENEVKYAIKILLKNDLIVIKEGRYIPTFSHIKKSPGFAGFYWKVYMESMLGCSLKGLELPKDIRDISAVTCNFSRENFQEAQQLIAELRKKLLNLSENSRNKRVYQCNIQLIPLSKEFCYDLS